MLTFLILVLALTAMAAGGTTLDCPLFHGTILAGPSDDLGLGAWRYELTVHWDTGGNGVSHINMIVDDGENCSEADLVSGLNFAPVAGHADGEPDCVVDFYAMIEVNGDPSIPGVTEPLIKFEYSDDSCELGSTGTAVLVFYSEYAPHPIMEENLFLVEKHANNNCRGTVTGVFPGLPCSPVSSEIRTFGALKAHYGS